MAEHKPESKKRLNEVLEHVWDTEISRDIIELLVNSMPSRIKAVITAKGGATRY